MEMPDEKIMSISDIPYFEEFKSLIDKEKTLSKIQFFDKTDISYSNSVSSVYSSNIEGNPIDLNSYMRIINSNVLKLKKEKFVLEIEHLKEAYDFAQKNVLNIENFLKSHEIMSKDLKISKNEKGNWRIGEEEAVYSEMELVYVAIETKYVKPVMENFFKDISNLLKKELEIDEILYYSALIHLIFVKIHPFRDGNGRAARLIQKWFISQKLGELAWKIPFESYFKKHQEKYYKNLDIGVNFYESDIYSKKVFNFLKMNLHAIK